VIGFFLAGHHTTAGLASLFSAIATDPGVRDALIAEPGLIPKAAEEAIRLETPLHGFYRQPTKDVEVQGCPIPQGSEVWLNYAAGNRDPAAFDRAGEFSSTVRRARISGSDTVSISASAPGWRAWNCVRSPKNSCGVFRSDRYRRAGRVPLGCGQHHEHRPRPRAVHACRTRPEGYAWRPIVLSRSRYPRVDAIMQV
jgi:hypothetical protein